MSVEKIKIEKEVNKKLSRRASARKFFNDLDKSFTDIVFDFEKVEFISRFAQKYIYQKHNIGVNLTEKNMNNFVENMLNIVERDYTETFGEL